MAIPITNKPSSPTRPAQDEALQAAYALLQQLHERGVLELLQGIVGGSDAIATKLSQAANSEEAINATRNLISLARILASIDPDVLQNLADELSRPQDSESRPALGILFSGDLYRGLAGAAAFVQAFGRALRRRQ